MSERGNVLVCVFICGLSTKVPWTRPKDMTNVQNYEE